MTRLEFQAAERQARFYLSTWRDSPEFEDLVAEVILEAWRKHARDGGRYRLRTYLKTAARYKPIDWFRSPRCGHLIDGYYQVQFRMESYEALMAAYEAGAGTDAPLEPAAPDFAPAVVRRVGLGPLLARLSERERELLRLTYEEELSAREIAVRVGSTRGAVIQALRKALERLRRQAPEALACQ